MNKSVILVTFDIFRPDYNSISYSVASLLSTLKNRGIECSHYPINIEQYIGKSNKGVSDSIKQLLKKAISYFKKFDIIAIGVSRWSLEHTNTILELLDDYTGKIILGGYEITAIDEADLIKEFPKADYFIKGYAEKALVMIVNDMYTHSQKTVRESLDVDYLYSPYSTGILNTLSRKIHWETKRGCQFTCGFCEWGNSLNRKTVCLNNDTIDRDIELFQHSNIEEINILDGTFNVKNDYLLILNKLVQKTKAKITFQARFEALNEPFIKFCAKHNDRLHLEFGLQTIHPSEEKTIGRKNNLEIIQSKLKQLNLFRIDYEVSIIYAIPGQTAQSFIDTIEFLKINGCKKIMAYPLQIPRNSELEKNKDEYKITFQKDRYNVTSVSSSFSFNKYERADMDRIAQSINKNNKTPQPFKNFLKIDYTKYQHRVTKEYVLINYEIIREHIINNFIKPTLDDIRQDFNYMEYLVLIGGSIMSVSPENLIKYALGETPIRFIDMYKGQVTADLGNGQVIPLNRIENLKPTDFYCRLVLGESGSLYVYRDIIERNNK